MPAPRPAWSTPLLAALTLSISLSISLLGCSTGLATASAEPTGCPAEQLEISDARQPMEGPSSWNASCSADGQRWFCSRAHQRVICTTDPRPRAD